MTGAIILILGIALIVAVFFTWYFIHVSSERERAWYIERGYDPHTLPKRATIKLQFPWLKLGFIVFLGALFASIGLYLENIQGVRAHPEVYLFVGAGLGLIISWFLENRNSGKDKGTETVELKRIEYFEKEWVGSLSDQLNEPLLGFRKGNTTPDRGKGDHQKGAAPAAGKVESETAAESEKTAPGSGENPTAGRKKNQPENPAPDENQNRDENHDHSSTVAVKS